MNMHDAWSSSTAPAPGDLHMDELTSRQLADELTTLASSMFGLLQPHHPGADSAAAGSADQFGTALTETPPLQVSDPASVVSVAIPVEPAVAVAVQESSAASEFDAEAPALEVPALAVPELSDGLDKLDQREATPLDQREATPDGLDKLDQHDGQPAVASLSLVPATENSDGLDKLDQREANPLDQREPNPLDQREPNPTPIAPPSLALALADVVEAAKALDELEEREPAIEGLDRRDGPDRRGSMALLNEIAFLDD
jgi:hypothetical protein